MEDRSLISKQEVPILATKSRQAANIDTTDTTHCSVISEKPHDAQFLRTQVRQRGVCVPQQVVRVPQAAPVQRVGDGHARVAAQAGQRHVSVARQR